MSSPMNRFNGIARYYDRLAAFVYGKSIREAQTFFLNEIRPGSKVLILGGGTGWILNVLFRIQPDCKVWYIEASSAMIESARLKSLADHERITFIHGTEDSIPEEIRFDVTIGNFFLDLFSSTSLKDVIIKIKKSLQPDGVLVVTDFIDRGKIWQKALLGGMYLFFRITCGVGSTQLPAWEEELKGLDLVEFKSNIFFCSFIKSALFRKHEGDQ
jgi:tRNA (cmo5U34)-methyltransferase